MHLHHVRAGRGEPLLLIHGLGGTWRSWHPVLPALVRARELVVLDLPGHGSSARLPGRPTLAALTDALESFVRVHGLEGAACVGSSMGGRMALELARRHVVGATVAFDPGGFWEGWERRWLETTQKLTIRLLRRIEPAIPALSRSAIGRTLLLAQLSARPWRLEPDFVAEELQGCLRTPTFEDLLADLAHAPAQDGTRVTRGPITIAWGRRDRLTPPRQARRAAERFPTARVVLMDRCGHHPCWDAPEEAVATILEGIGARVPAARGVQAAPTTPVVAPG